LPPTWLCFNTRRHDRFPPVRDHDDITGLKVRRRVLEETEIIAGCVVETVDGQCLPSIDRLASKRSRGSTRGKYANRLEALAKQAKAKKLGLWGTCRHTQYDPYRGVQTRR
jgi:hypothetical protein